MGPTELPVLEVTPDRLRQLTTTLKACRIASQLENLHRHSTHIRVLRYAQDEWAVEASDFDVDIIIEVG
jgi:hypothetical protein